MTAPPSGTVTFLFTDIEGSTRLWEDDPEGMRAALAEHDNVVRGAIEAHGGYVFSTGGDGYAAAFTRAADAIDAAQKAQAGLAEHQTIRVRMGIHTGEVEERNGDYFGPAVNRAARLMALGHGRQVLVSAATEGLLDDHVERVDLGEHRLRNVARPQRVFQIGSADTVRAFPPLRSESRRPSRLPAAQTSFVGRADEVAKLSDAVRDERLVTLIGVGGVGKTRLALEVASELEPELSDGAVLCELASVTDRSDVADAVASSVGARIAADIPTMEAIVATIAGRELLLVLDNCEHVLEAAGAVADSIVRSCPEATVLATSRESLGVEAEVLRPVRSLTTPRPDGSPDQVAEAESAQLFAARAAAVRPDFELDATSSGAVAEICRSLDGVPLAIELAAARMGSLTAAEIAARLDERFRLLTGGRRHAIERHQTLRATVDWSYELLPAAESTVFGRLSVFVGGFTLEAAESVVSGDGIDEAEVLDLISHLVERSMVEANESAGTTRYRLLETMRQYARERLDAAGDTDRWRERHAHYFLELAERAGAGSWGPDELRWAAVVSADLPNFRAALDWYAGEQRAEDALRLCLSVAQLSHWVPTRFVATWLRVALAVPGARDATLRARARSWDAYVAAFHVRQTAPVAEKISVMEEAYEQAHLPLDSIALHTRMVLAILEARWADAVEEATAALAVAPERGVVDRGWALAACAQLFLMVGRPEEALEYAEQAVAAAASSGSVIVRANADSALGGAMAEVDPERAMAYLEQSRSRVPPIQGFVGPIGDRVLARLRARHGDLFGALSLYAETLQSITELDHLAAATTCESLAVDLSRSQHDEVAAVLFGALGADPFPGNPSVGREGAIEQLRARHGDRDYDALAERGSAMGTKEMLAYARTEAARILAELEADR